MSVTLARIKILAGERAVRVSDHAYEALRNDDIRARDLIMGLADAQVVEDYPDYALGPCVLVLQKDRDNRPVHVVWGIPKGKLGPAVLVTAYRPTLSLWSADFLERKKP
jgi:hypothetical protein